VRPVVHVTGRIPERVHAALAETFTLADNPEGADGILSLLTTTVDGALLDRAGPQLRTVANYGVGVDNVDLEAARARGVVVANTPDVLTDATAELAIGPETLKMRTSFRPALNAVSDGKSENRSLPDAW
jgi:glyoxylate reductase